MSLPGGHPGPELKPVTRASGKGKVACLTFDDGPNGRDTEVLLDFLAARGLRAVFCVIGAQIRAGNGAALLRRIVADGHVLANHSTSYADMGDWDTEAVRADLTENLAIIREALGEPAAPVPYWRPPNGSWGVTAEVAVELGMQPLGVEGAIGDWAEQDAKVLASRIREVITPGSMLLAHDGGGDRAGTVRAVMSVVDELLAQGWSFTLPER